jgi:ceramide glucosyltransferase
MALRGDVLEALGGFSILADYCADDYVLGERVYQRGWKVILSEHVIDHVVISRRFAPSMRHQIRWMKSTRFSRGWAHVGTGLTFAMPYAMLLSAMALARHNTLLAVGILAFGAVNRMLLALISGWGVVHDPRSLRYCWLYPLRDLMGFLFWCASFVGDSVVWRDRVYRLVRGGKMIPVGVTEPESDSEAVAVDHLA